MKFLNFFNFILGPCTNMCARHFVCAVGNVLLKDYERCFRNGEHKIFNTSKQPRFIWRKFGPKFGWPIFQQVENTDQIYILDHKVNCTYVALKYTVLSAVVLPSVYSLHYYKYKCTYFSSTKIQTKFETKGTYLSSNKI